ncbi:MAG: hypothetical protein KGJ24_02515 [Burkholderiales bacterium]|nr:hypothetical protein [Burkholderiales bacterium]
MGRPPRQLPSREPRAGGLPPPDEVLAAIAQILAPLLRLLLAAGLDYTRLAAELKPLFVEQARQELLREGRADTDSALSLLSGVHRKDVREWRSNGLSEKIAGVASLSSKVFARWVQDPLYCDRRKRPRALPRLGPAPSFETLSRSVTLDVHPYTALGELLRLGLVRVETRRGVETIVPVSAGYVPGAGSSELLALFGGNVADHAAAAVHNLLGQPSQLEQSVFAEGITAASAQQLRDLARELWLQARREMIEAATRLYQADQGRPDATHRMRFGVYYWTPDAPPEPAARATTDRSQDHEPT